MKKLAALLLACILTLSLVPALADGIGTGAYPASSESLLLSLTNNCPNTGKMLPETFNPNQTTYLLTVASWVSRVSFTPTAYSAAASITVNGQAVASGAQSAYIQMTDEPQAVTITVTSGSASTVYTVYLQRRPSDKRTRVSAGYISQIYQNNNTYYISADLVNVNYKSNKYSDGSRSTFTNDSTYLYKYAVDPNCVFYYAAGGSAVRAQDIFEFITAYNANPSAMYRIVYIEDIIVAVMPYTADY